MMTIMSCKKLFLTCSLLLLSLYGSYAHAADDIWSRGGEFFIRLEPQDTLRNASPPPNAHPAATVTAESLRNALSLVFYAPASDDEATPLFAERTLDLLGVALEKGLKEASPRQDVTFIVETWHELFLGLSEAVIVGGRAFFVGDSLNLIIGSMRSPNVRSLSEGENQVVNKDSRLYPYHIGNRDKRIKHKGIISAEANSGVFAASNNRRDWLVFTPFALGMGDRATVEKNVTPSPSQQKSRVPSTLMRDNQQIIDPDILAQRLEALKKLRDSGLISNKDFEEKKKEILSNL